jgi:hypothetical protein
MNRYTNMSTKEIVQSLIKLPTPTRNQEIAKLSPEQYQQIMTFIQSAEKKHTPGEELLALIGGGILFLVMWGILGSLGN